MAHSQYSFTDMFSPIRFIAEIALTAVVVAAFLTFVSGSPWFQYPLGAVLAYAVAMLVILVARKISPITLPHWYFRIRAFENGGRLYLVFGIRFYKKLLVYLGIDACNWLVRFSGQRSGLERLVQGLRQAETDHLMSFLVLLLVFPYALQSGWYEVAGWVVLVNTMANVYPVMLQRHNRARIEPLLEIA